MEPPPPPPPDPTIARFARMAEGFEGDDFITDDLQAPWEEDVELGRELGMKEVVSRFESGGGWILQHITDLREQEEREQLEEQIVPMEEYMRPEPADSAWRATGMARLQPGQPQAPSLLRAQILGDQLQKDRLEDEAPPWEGDSSLEEVLEDENILPPQALSRTYMGPMGASARAPAPRPHTTMQAPPAQAFPELTPAPPPGYRMKWVGTTPQFIRLDRPAPPPSAPTTPSFVPPKPPPRPPLDYMSYTSGDAPENTTLHILADFFARQTVYAHDKIKDFRRDEQMQFGPLPMWDTPEYRKAYRDFVAKAQLEQEQQKQEEHYEMESDPSVKQQHLQQAQAAAAKRGPDTPVYAEEMVPPNLRRARAFIKAVNEKNYQMREHIIQHGNFGDMPPRPPLYDPEFYPGKERAVLRENDLGNNARMMLRNVLEDMGMLVGDLVEPARSPLRTPTRQGGEEDMIDWASPQEMRIPTPQASPGGQYTADLLGLFN